MERWRERVPDFRGCDAEAASARCADKQSREEISVGESEGTSGMTGMTRMNVGKLKSTKSDVGYFEVDAVFNREPVELLEENT